MIKFLLTILSFNSKLDKKKKKTDVGICPLFIIPFGHIYFFFLLKINRLPVTRITVRDCRVSCFRQPPDTAAHQLYQEGRGEEKNCNLKFKNERDFPEFCPQLSQFCSVFGTEGYTGSKDCVGLSSCFLRQLNGVQEKRDANREIKNAPSALLSSRVFLEIPKCL